MVGIVDDEGGAGPDRVPVVLGGGTPLGEEEPQEAARVMRVAAAPSRKSRVTPVLISPRA
jgi:hypothetical protein